MTNPRIVFDSAGVAAVRDIEKPSPKSGEVLLRIETTTISSGTERANLLGDPRVSIAPNAVDDVPFGDPSLFPRVCGYSAAGIVEEVGENVKDIKVGDRVAASWTKHQRYICVGEKNIHKLPDNDFSFSVGSIVHIATFPLAAIRKCNLELGESAAVMGLGILGLIALQLLKAAGATPVIAVDPVPEKRALALSMGADYAFDPFEKDFADKVKQVTDGGLKVAIEVTGNGKALDTVLDCMAKFGRLALLGCTRNSDFTIDYYKKVHGPGISLIGAHTLARHKLESAHGNWTEHDDAMAIIRLEQLGRTDLKKLVSEVHSPLEAPEVFHRLATEKAFPVVQFDWSEI